MLSVSLLLVKRQWMRGLHIVPQNSSAQRGIIGSISRLDLYIDDSKFLYDTNAAA